MKTSIIAFGIALMMLGMGAFGIIKMDEVKQQKKVLERKEFEIKELNLLIDEEIVRSDILESDNQILQDSIVELNSIIFTLREELRAKDEKIAYLKGKIKRRDVSIQDLKDEITLLYRKQHLDKNAIAEKEKEIQRLKNEKVAAQASYKNTMASKQATSNELNDYENNVNEMQLLTELVENTKVSFINVAGKKYKNGRKISKMRKNMNGWQYTDFSFKMSNKNHRALLNKKFILKIYDLDNEMVLTYLEENPLFPNNNLRGIPFSFDGNTIELTYCNMQKKKSENYELRIYLVHDGEEIALEKGILPIITNGDFIEI